MADLIFGLGSILLALSLLFSVFSGNKPDARTSFITWIVLWAFGVAYATIHLPFAAITAFLSGGIWLILLLQKINIQLNEYERREFG